MGWRMRRSYRIAPGVRLNVSKSGVSTSSKLGPVTVNSRRGATVRVAKGMSYTASPTSAKKKTGTSSEEAVTVAKKKSGGCCLWPFMLTLVVCVAGIVALVKRVHPS